MSTATEINPAVAAPAGSGTARTLRRLRAGLLAAVALALTGCLSVFLGVDRTADAAATRTAPAILAVHEAQVALRTAHAAAVTSFRSGEASLGGPGELYQNQFAVAGQSLARAAAHNAAGPAGERDIQVVEALLVTYAGLIGQADVHFRRDGDAPLGAADLLDASNLLDEIVARLDTLLDKQEEALAQQARARWASPLAALAWAAPVTVLLALLVAAQIFLRRRFRRLVNPPLLLATALTLALTAGTAVSVVSARQLAAARAAVATADADRRARTEALRRSGLDALADLVRRECGPAGRGCGPAVEQLVAPGRAPARSAPTPEAGGRPSAGRVTAAAAAAADSRRVEFALPATAVAIAALVLAGLQPRLDEYRYRSR